MSNSFYLQKSDINKLLDINECQNFSFPIHFHKGCEIAYVLNGNVNVTINNKTYSGKEDMIFFINPYQSHGYKDIDGHNKMLMFIPSSFYADFEQMFKTHLIPSELTDFEFNKKIKKLLYELSTLKNQTFLVIKGYVNIIIGEIVSHYKLETIKNTTKNDIIINILQYIENNFNKDLSLPSISANFNYTPSYFSKFFKKNIGENYVDYVAGIRISHFLKLANDTKETNITDQALACGFDSLSTFYRVFKKIYGKSPKDFLLENSAFLDHK